jgi:hypothetical protein
MKRLSIRQCALLFTGLWQEHHDIEAVLAPIVDQAYRAGVAAGRGRRTSNVKLQAAPHMLAVAGIKRAAHPYRLAVARRHQVSPATVTSRGRVFGRALLPVAELAWLLRHCAGMSYPHIAIACERSNHTTAMAAVRRVEVAIEARPGLRDELLALVTGGRVDALVAAVGG